MGSRLRTAAAGLLGAGRGHAPPYGTERMSRTRPWEGGNCSHKDTAPGDSNALGGIQKTTNEGPLVCAAPGTIGPRPLRVVSLGMRLAGADSAWEGRGGGLAEVHPGIRTSPGRQG